MANTLVAPADLSNLPGAPFTDVTVDAAVAQVRYEAGWHIAPKTPAAETVTVDGVRGTRLVLPSRRVVSVAEVRDVADPANPVVLTGWRLAKAAILVRDSWPCGDDVIEVDMIHGFDATPPELLPLVAALARGSASDSSVIQLGSLKVEQVEAGDDDAAPWAALDPYRARAGF